MTQLVFASLTLAGVASTGGSLAAQSPAPTPTAAQTQPTALVYPASDPAKDIAVALASASKDGKHLLLDFGADWCPDCRVLGALFEDPLVKPFADANFHIIRIDVGRRDKNMDLVEKYGADAGAWIPSVVVLDAAGAKVAETTETVRLTRRDTPQLLLDRLKQWAPKQHWVSLASFTERGVRVDIALERDSSGQTWLAGTFAPTEANTHLYARELPAGGVDGLGRPTRLAMTSAIGLKVRGEAIANRAVEEDRIDVLKQTLLVYPPGSVTLRIPVDVLPGGPSGRAELAFGYMACGPKGCLPPVTDKRVSVMVPETR